MIMGQALNNRAVGDQADNLKWNFAFHTDALGLWTREALPLDWVRAQLILRAAFAMEHVGCFQGATLQAPRAAMRHKSSGYPTQP
jgi:hypothetical protein